MDNFWIILSSIGTFVGALATAAACIIALRPYERKLKLSADIYEKTPLGMYVGGYFNIDLPAEFQWNIYNNGFQPITFRYVGFAKGRSKKISVCNPEDSSDGIIAPGSNHTVNPGEEYWMSITSTKIIEYIKQNYDNPKEVRLVCRDISNKYYYAKLPKHLIDKLSET